MATQNQAVDSETFVQAGLFVVVSTAVLTASFLGIVGHATGRVSGVAGRIPYYVLLMAVSFVVAVIGFESLVGRASEVLSGALLATGIALVLVILSGEGIVYLLQHTEAVLSSQLLIYILAAGLVGTGLCYWAFQHWAELANTIAGH
ncbi:hypothetical protein [Halovenus sp. HT40]|uniref:hypothetical protein n=1 Tax=Halovenus sp. HT40 TaxID=3126691 RepID=UPI00300F6251